MVYDTLRQKFIYDTPFDKDEFPKLCLINENSSFKKPYIINASSLYFLEKDDFTSLIKVVRKEHDSLIINNDYSFINSNKALEEGAKCYVMAFAFLFQKEGLLCKIESIKQKS